MYCVYSLVGRMVVAFGFPSIEHCGEYILPSFFFFTLLLVSVSQGLLSSSNFDV